MNRTTSSLVRILMCGLFLLFTVGAANAQFKAGIQGTVADETGALVPGATVTLTSKDTGKTQTVTTSDEGFYRISGLPPGNYSLSVEKTGFKKQLLANVTVGAEAVQGLDVTLTTGAPSETVTVTEGDTKQLETENASISRAITTREVRQLPQVGRDPYELVRLTPGVFGDGARGGGGNSVGLPNTAGPGGSNSSIFQTENQVPITANGQRLSSNNFQIDGVSVNSLGFGGAAVITPNQESVKEIRVLSTSYSAEDGRNSGAQIKVVSQNGTNQLHGSAFIKYDSPKLNAFNKLGDVGPTPSSPNGAPVRVSNLFRQFGGSLGGPLYLPRFGEGGSAIYNGKNKLFFFFSYEGLRQSNTDTTTQFVETPEYRQLVQTLRPNSIIARVFSATGIAPRVVSVLPVGCSAYSTAFGPRPCAVVNGGLDIGSPTGAQGTYVGLGNPGGGGLDGIPDIQLAQIALPGSSRGNQFNLRFDYNHGSKDSFAFSTYQTHLFTLGSDFASQGRPIGDLIKKPKNTAFTFTYNRIINASMLNEARFNITRFADNQVQDTADTNFGIPRIEVEGMPLIPSGGRTDRIRFGAPQGDTSPGIFAQNTYELSDTLSKVIGNQGLKFGGVIRKEQDNNSLVGAARPVYSFSGLFNLANDTPIFEGIAADPVTGRPADAQRYFRTNYFAFFGQDDWKVRPNLTVNLGLRYEYFAPPTEKRGRLSNLVLGSNGLTNARVVPVTQLFKPDRNNFAPRLGFAYSPKSFGMQDKLVIRGGFGISYNRIPDVLFTNTRANPPNFAKFGLCCGTSPADFGSPFAGGTILYALGAGNSIFSYPANPALAQGIDPATGAPRNRTVEIWGAFPDEPNSYVYSYSLEGQYSLPYNLVATLGYQGSAGHKLIRLGNLNFFLTNNNSFDPVFFSIPDGNSNYNALNAELTRRFGQGFQLQANYRFSKSIDTLSYEGPSAETNQTFPQDQHTERGPSDFDVRHSFVTSALYDLPIFRHRHGALGAILGGFQIDGILTAHTGFPFTPKSGACVSTAPGRPFVCPSRPVGFFGGNGTDTSNNAFITGSNFAGIHTNGLPFFNINNPGGLLPPGIGRNSFRGPRYFNIDLSLVKQVTLARILRREDANIEFRANFFNAFNQLNLAPIRFFSPGTFVDNPNFDRTERGLAGRVVELQARIRF